MMNDATAQSLRARWQRRSISVRLFFMIFLTILAVEVLLLAPSLANYRINWFHERVEAAYLVGLALESPSGEMISANEAEIIFATANIRGVTIERDGTRILIMAPTDDPGSMPVAGFVDLSAAGTFSMVTAPFAILFSNDDILTRVTGKSRYADDIIDILIAQQDLRADLRQYAWNILRLSLLISVLTGGFVYWRLNRLIVVPVQRMTENMTAFEQAPEEAGNVLVPSARLDEIGEAEAGLATLEVRLQSLLAERQRLAAVGAGVSKISHDLRNVLASAQLMSDRLARSDDPRVQKLSPRLISSLDRAITLSRDTLNYARMSPEALRKSKTALSKIVDDVFDDAASMRVTFESDVPDGLEMVVDGSQIYRAIFNIVRNSVDAMVPAAPPANKSATASANMGASADGANPPDEGPLGKVTISAHADSQHAIIRIADTGPGIPDAARDFLFEPFKGSMKPGGSGLGVAIAQEIIKAHGGQLRLASSDKTGTVFEISLPR